MFRIMPIWLETNRKSLPSCAAAWLTPLEPGLLSVFASSLLPHPAPAENEQECLEGVLSFFSLLL